MNIKFCLKCWGEEFDKFEYFEKQKTYQIKYNIFTVTNKEDFLKQVSEKKSKCGFPCPIVKTFCGSIQIKRNMSQPGRIPYHRRRKYPKECHYFLEQLISEN